MKKLKLFITLIMVAIITVCNTACTDNTQKGNNPTIPVTKGTDGLEYTLSDDGKYAICTGLGSADESTITISSHYDGVVVEEIKSSAFSDKDSIEKLIIPDGVKKIGRRAFLGCDNLVSLTLPTTLAEIATEAFYSCEKLYLVNNHSNLNIMRWSGENGFVAYYACKVYDAETETIGHIKTEGDYVTFSFDEEKYIVAYNGNESVPVIPSDVTGINSFAFYQNTNVTKLKIPSNLKAIGAYAFWGNTLLKQVTFEENCSLEIIGAITFENCPIESFTFNDDIDTWLNISFESPESNPLSFVEIFPLKVGDIENIVTGESVTFIKKNAFYNCRNIKNVTVSAGVTEIQEGAFYNSSLENITFAENSNLKKIGVNCFSRETTTADDTINATKGKPGPQITDLIIPASVEVIDTNAFMNCEALKSVVIKDNNKLTTIGDYAFCGCEQLERFIIGNDSALTKIGKYALQANRKMTEFDLGRNSVLHSIGSMAFQYSNGLTKFFIPKSVEYISSYCFGAIGGRAPDGGRDATLYIEADKDGIFWDSHYNSSVAKTAYGVSYDEYLTK